MKLDLSNSTTSVFMKNLRAKTFYVFNRGGSRSSKTYSLMQIAYLIATLNDNKTISVVSESLPHLKKGCMKDFFDFLKKNKLYDIKNHNKTDNSYSFSTGSVIEFFGVESASKVHGAGRDYLFANEIQNLSYETFFQLTMRTTVRVYADYNPIRRFWVDTEYLDNPNFKEKCTMIHSTLFDNEFCPANIKDVIMARAMTDINYKRVYLDGEIGSVEGLVYPTYTIVPKDIPEEYELIGLGLDWGFTTDPCACIAVYKCQNRLRFKQLVYETGLVNNKLVEKIHAFGVGVKGDYKMLPVIADNAEPKSITDLCNAGINCKKITDKSIVYGIKKLKEFILEVTEDSTGLISELNSYMWDKDNNGKYIEYPVDKDNHACFIGSTNIITIDGIKQIKDITINDKVLTRYGYNKVLKKHDNGIKEVNEYIIDIGDKQLYITATKDHKIYTNNGWRELCQLKKQDKILVNKNLMEKSITSIQKKDTLVEVLIDYTESFGSSLMERYQLTMKYIIKILIPIITTLITSNVLQKKNMLLDIKEDVQTNNDNTYQILETKLKNGMDQKKDVNGIKNILNIYMTRLKEIVQNVVKNIKHISKMVIPSVLINVNQNSEEKVESIISREHVLNAVKNSSHIDIIKQNLVEVEIVNIHCSSKQNQRVYDLTVEDDHEYIANDILVHNCDAVRYFCMEIFGKKKNVASSEVF